MELPFDIIDHIFGFLKFHPKALLACSKAHPVLSQIVERYRFRHIIVNTGCTDFTHSFNPFDLRRLLVETPRIVKFVTVLQIELTCYPIINWMNPYLEEIASLLPMFPALECIILPTQTPRHPLSWKKDLPQAFRTAVEDCFNLPSLQEVHIGNLFFPISILNNHANINYLSLSGPPILETKYLLETTYPQIKTLTLETFPQNHSDVFLAWARRHIVGLQSLEYDFSCHEIVLQVFKICSDTLEDLYLNFHYLELGLGDGVIRLSSLPHLRHLTIHVNFQGSNLQRAVERLKTASELQKLTIGIYVHPSMVDHKQIFDLSPLRILTDSSCRFPCVDLYMYTGSPNLPITHAMMYSWLSETGGLVELIERGMLIVHPEETAPAFSRAYIAKEQTRFIDF